MAIIRYFETTVISIHQ